jgi:hypothetical protein
MPDKPAFIERQYAFAAHLRDPDNNPAPAGIEDRRLEIYRGLFYRNIENFIAGSFPVIRKLYRDDDWQRMVRDFMARHQSRSPYFLEISREFLVYLQQERRPEPCDPPFLLELAHYEWAELALSVVDSPVDIDTIDPNAALLDGHPVVSPLAWVLSYRWPVHQLGPGYIPSEPPEQTTHIVVYRDRKDQVRFVLINPVTARLLYLLEKDDSLTGRDALKMIIGELQHPKPEVVMQGGAQALEQLKSQGIILGTHAKGQKL